jgi:hypothetical protein
MGDHRFATSFLQDLKNKITALPRTEIETWPNWPAIPAYPLEAPSDLSSYTFTLMKNTFPDGRTHSNSVLSPFLFWNWLDVSLSFPRYFVFHG